MYEKKKTNQMRQNVKILLQISNLIETTTTATK